MERYDEFNGGTVHGTRDHAGEEAEDRDDG